MRSGGIGATWLSVPEVKVRHGGSDEAQNEHYGPDSFFNRIWNRHEKLDDIKREPNDPKQYDDTN
jgi:hypothetical protein